VKAEAAVEESAVPPSAKKPRPSGPDPKAEMPNFFMVDVPTPTSKTLVTFDFTGFNVRSNGSGCGVNRPFASTSLKTTLSLCEIL
jgi:hypothetical protein